MEETRTEPGKRHGPTGVHLVTTPLSHLVSGGVRQKDPEYQVTPSVCPEVYHC